MTSDYDKEKLQERLAKLAGGVAVIRVGGATEVEVKEKKDRVEDALHPTRAAVEEDILPRGGVPLLRAGKALEGIKTENDDQRTGVDIARRALQWPARPIVDNAGVDAAVVAGKLIEHKDYAYGYDAQAGEYGDLYKTRHHRPDQGRAHGRAGRGVCRESLERRPKRGSPKSRRRRKLRPYRRTPTTNRIGDDAPYAAQQPEALTLRGDRFRLCCPAPYQHLISGHLGFPRRTARATRAKPPFPPPLQPAS